MTSRLSGSMTCAVLAVLVAASAGASQANLTNNPAFDGSPAWSPDGSQIAFVTNRDGDREIYVMSADGSDQVNLTVNSEYDEWDPVWSNDGARIAFESDRHGRTSAWNFIMNADGSDADVLSSNGYINGDPRWSPDGNWIAFYISSGRLGNGDISIMDSAGTEYVAWYGKYLNLTQNGLDNRNPAWSPDGFSIAFASKRDGNGEIYVMDDDGAEQVNLTSSPADDDFPAWSPDDSRIAFTSAHGLGLSDIWIIRDDGSDPRNLTDDASVNESPTWSPDGARIAFVSDRDGNREIYVVGVEGS